MDLDILNRVFLITRKKLDIDQIEFANKLKISQAHLSKIECGRKIPSMHVLEKLSVFVNIPIGVTTLFYFLNQKDLYAENNTSANIIIPIIKKLLVDIFPELK